MITGFRGEEGISELFSYELDLISEYNTIKFDDIIGQNVTIGIALADDSKRHINGIISNFSLGSGSAEEDADLRFSFYKATMVPWLWLLTKTTDCRIFQNLSVPDIVSAIFQDYPNLNYHLRLKDTYEPRVYTVQYRETDFNFVSRLLEDEGIFYFFEHENGEHTLVLADSSTEHQPCPKQETARYQYSGHGWLEEDVLKTWEVAREIQAGKCTLRDFNFEIPHTDLTTTRESTCRLGPCERELYDYPGKFKTRNTGDRRTTVRIEAEECRLTTIKGSSNCRAFASGYRFVLKDYFRSDMDQKPYVLTRVEHTADQSGTFPGLSPQGTSEDTGYANLFECIPHEVLFRPLRTARKPVVEGVQTAFVIGPEGEEIYTDQHGRVKVLFHWDREGGRNGDATCWIRVAQSMAGIRWGGVTIPRVGHEVIVHFIEGDPDRPIIIGQVYNGINTPPYILPNEKTITTFKSNSSLGGGGFNELRFEDKKAEEQLFIHAEKNQDIRVKNDCFEWIGKDRHLVVKQDQKEQVNHNRHEKVGADHVEEVGKDRHLKVKGKEAKEVDGSHSFTVKGDVIEVFKANHSEQVTKDYYLKGSNIVIEAMTNVTVKVGQSYVAIEAGGIKIGTTGQIVLEAKNTVGVEGTAGVTIQSPAQATLKSTNTTVKGDAVTTIQGGLVKIN
jgi:type VI secretion system secreted protein VgrG